MGIGGKMTSDTKPAPPTAASRAAAGVHDVTRREVRRGMLTMVDALMAAREADAVRIAALEARVRTLESERGRAARTLGGER